MQVVIRPFILLVGLSLPWYNAISVNITCLLLTRKEYNLQKFNIFELIVQHQVLHQ